MKQRGAYVIRASGGWSNQELTKDCGMIPYLLHKNHGFRGVMIGSGKFDSEKFSYLEHYVHGLEMDFLPENTLQAQLEYINRHAVDMDLIILYGARPQYAPVVDFYRRLRPDGKIYLAADMDSRWAVQVQFSHLSFKKMFATCDVVATSCRAVQKQIIAKWNIPIELIRNGWYNFPKVSFDNLFERKENIILTVGRIGTDQKRNEDLLNAFAKVANDLPDWSVRLVGNVTESFKPYIEKYFEAHPDLCGRVTFTGLIEDKIELSNEFKRAKIFCMTSTFEGGTPNVTAEALFAGDFMIFSAIDAAYEATDNNKCGRVFPIGDVNALAKIFLEVCPNADLLLKGGKHAVEYARRNFDAEHIVAKLHYLLYGGDAQ